MLKKYLQKFGKSTYLQQVLQQANKTKKIFKVNFIQFSFPFFFLFIQFLKKTQHQIDDGFILADFLISVNWIAIVLELNKFCQE